MIPDLKCQHCNKCCNHIIWFEPENLLINKFLKNNFFIDYNIKKDAKIDQNKCPFLRENRCSIYPVRPIVCRLQGNVEELFCHSNINNKFMDIDKLDDIRDKLIYLISKTNSLDYFYSSRNIRLRCLNRNESRK